jgi:hypothetical protein
MRFRLFRNLISVPASLPENLIFKIVETKKELEDAFGLVYQAYLPKGYCEENDHKMRATIYHALPTTTTLVALDNGKVIGTLTMVRNNRLNLPLEKQFDIKFLKQKGSRVAEITSLVIDKEYRRNNGGQVLFPLLKLMYEYATFYFGVSHLVVTVHPKDADFYKALLLFQDVSKTEKTKYYLGAPATALFLDLKEAHVEFHKVYKDKPEHQNLFKFFVHQELPNIILPKREFHTVNDPIVTLEYYRELFVKKLKLNVSNSDAIKNFKERREIESYLKDSTNNGRMNKRFEVESSAEFFVEGKKPIGKVKVKDVSYSGFRAFLPENFRIESTFDVRIEVGTSKFSNLKAKLVWIDENQGLGFEVLQSDALWDEFVSYINHRHFGKTG